MKTVLHVGCGAATIAKMTQGFQDGTWKEVRFDINPDVRPDIVGTIQNMTNVPSDSFDALYSSHNIEHVFAHEVNQVLCEFRRVLKPTGFAVVTCPDVEVVAAHIAAGRFDEPLYVSPSGPISPIDVLYGHGASIARGEVYMAHRTAFSGKSLNKAFSDADFPVVGTRRIPKHFALWAIGFKSLTDEAMIRDAMATYIPPA